MIRQLIETPVGTLFAQWTSRGLYACEFREPLVSEESLESLSVSGSSQVQLIQASGGELESQITRYFDSGALHFDLEHLDWTGVSGFHRRVLELCFEVASGTTVSYGQLAAKAGSPGAARAVGGAMANNRWPILIPCHRVVGANGKLTGYSGVGGIATKRRLLEFESEQCGIRPSLFQVTGG